MILLEDYSESESTLQWRNNGCDSVSNHQPHDCFLNRLFRRISKKTSKLRVTGLCAGNSPGTGEFPAQMANNAEKFPFDDVIMELAWLLLMAWRLIWHQDISTQHVDPHSDLYQVRPYQNRSQVMQACRICTFFKYIFITHLKWTTLRQCNICNFMVTNAL